MADLKETPRQKMMGILYLVLLGLAATTVTDHVLDAFRNLTVSLETSSKNVSTTVDNTFASFEAKKMKDDPIGAKPFYDRATKVRQAANDLNSYIKELRGKLEQEGGGLNDNGDVAKRSNTDISPQFMIKKGNAAELKKRVNTTRDQILSVMTDNEKAGLKMSLGAEDPQKTKESLGSTWEEQNFGDGIPLTAAITALTKIQADLKNSESDAIRKILGDADRAQIQLNDFTGVAIPNSTYVVVGQQYKADIFLTAYNKNTNPEMVIGGQTLNVVDGKGLYTASASAPGIKKYSGTIRIKNTDGKIQEYPIPEQTYIVGPPSGVASPDKMNVFYVGIPNPVTISAAGFANDKVKASISGGSLTGGADGHYVVNVSKPGEVTINIAGEMDGGKSVALGTPKFRCKMIPAPHVRFLKKSGGSLGTAMAKGGSAIFAELDDFEFDAKFDISHFTLYLTVGHGDTKKLESNSNRFTAEMQSAMASVTPGSRFIFDNVQATGPDHVKRTLDPIVFNVQ